MIEIKGLNQFYGGSHILWDVDMTIPEGSKWTDQETRPSRDGRSKCLERKFV